MTIAILATGDELVHGDTLNTNSHEIAHILSSEGLPLGYHLLCSDKINDIVDCLNFLKKEHNIIIVIGGLGPTTDDLTRFALAQCTQEPLIEHKDALNHVENRLSAAKLTLNSGNLQQCLFPKQAKLLPNPNGTAMGCYYQWNNKLFILLPGPPRECLPMFNQTVLPLLHQTRHTTKEILKWRIFGVAESEIGQQLEETLAALDCQTGYRLDTPYIEFKVRCTKDLVEEVKSLINPILSPHIIATPDKKASDALRELILKLNTPISIIDEVTGGLLQSLLIKPGMQHLVDFHTLNKNTLCFYLRGLSEYWSQVPATNGKTQLSIQYSNKHQEGGESHVIPFRSAGVIFYAAEWLSFRLIHLINQLH